MTTNSNNTGTATNAVDFDAIFGDMHSSHGLNKVLSIPRFNNAMLAFLSSSPTQLPMLADITTKMHRVCTALNGRDKELLLDAVNNAFPDKEQIMLSTALLNSLESQFSSMDPRFIATFEQYFENEKDHKYIMKFFYQIMQSLLKIAKDQSEKIQSSNVVEGLDRVAKTTGELLDA